MTCSGTRIELEFQSFRAARRALVGASPTSDHRNSVPVRTWPRDRTASTALPFTPACPPWHARSLRPPRCSLSREHVHDLRGHACRVARPLALTLWHRPVERARKHAHPPPSRRLAHRGTPLPILLSYVRLPHAILLTLARTASRPPPTLRLLAYECAHMHVPLTPSRLAVSDTPAV